MVGITGGRRGLSLLLLTATLSGCVSHLPSAAAIEQVPFYAQTQLNCGPAALASALEMANIPATLPQLEAWMLTPNLAGTLQQDLLGASRRAGGLPVLLDPTLEAVAAQLRAGRPVIVLQNLRVPSWPAWHYALVIGLDEKKQLVHVAAEQPSALAAWRFDLSWRFADRWAVVVLKPGDPPNGLTLSRYLDAVAAMEAIAPAPMLHLAYTAGINYWPDAADLRFGLGNVLLAQGQLVQAMSQYEAAIQRAPAHLAAHNNLAEVQHRLGKVAQAQSTIHKALQMAGDSRLRAALMETARSIEAAIDSPTPR